MFSLSAVESALPRLSQCTHSCVCNTMFLRRQTPRTFFQPPWGYFLSSSYSSPTPSSLQYVPRTQSPSLPSPFSTEPCSRLLAPLPISGGVRRSVHQSSLHRTCASTPLLKSSKSRIDRSLVPELLEKDLVRSFIKGWGPGGQSVNKTNNAVFLKHVPTGLFVKVHMHRMQHKNVEEARLQLQEKLDNLLNGPMSVSAQKARLLEKKSSRNDNKAKKMRELKAQWKQSQGVQADGDDASGCGVTNESGCAENGQGLGKGSDDKDK